MVYYSLGFKFNDTIYQTLLMMLTFFSIMIIFMVKVNIQAINFIPNFTIKLLENDEEKAK